MNKTNIEIMPMPKPKGYNEELKRFEYHHVAMKSVESMEDIDNFEKWIPTLIISNSINGNIHHWYVFLYWWVQGIKFNYAYLFFHYITVVYQIIATLLCHANLEPNFGNH